MPKNANVSLSSYDDIFSTAEERQTPVSEEVKKIPLERLVEFKNHPFKVLDDEKMKDTVESVKQIGVVVPLIARPKEDGCFEIIAGHRRKHAAELAGLESVPVIVRDMDDDTAIILMVDSNLQREQILPSEKAWAYRMKMEAMKRQGQRTDLTSSPMETKLRTSEIIAQDAGRKQRSCYNARRTCYGKQKIRWLLRMGMVYASCDCRYRRGRHLCV